MSVRFHFLSQLPSVGASVRGAALSWGFCVLRSHYTTSVRVAQLRPPVADNPTVVDFHASHSQQGGRGSARRAASPLALALAGLLGYHLVVAGRCREFRHQALHDDLTGLPNRRCLDQVLSRTISAATRSGEGASLVLIDLDHFKELNDSLGHAEGDAVLREAARRFKSALRQGDFLARVGGDEFCLLLPRTDLEAAAGLAGRLRTTLSERPAPWEPRPSISMRPSA